MGYDILVLDHHEAERYSDHAVVINNQLSKNYPNKALSGVGVVYKFLEHIDYETQKENLKEEEGFVEPYSYNYLDLVALGEISDVMDMTTLENRWIVSAGLSNINNKFF
jgi:single-stranded-DNA-specific exonuclease